MDNLSPVGKTIGHAGTLCGFTAAGVMWAIERGWIVVSYPSWYIGFAGITATAVLGAVGLFVERVGRN